MKVAVRGSAIDRPRVRTNETRKSTKSTQRPTVAVRNQCYIPLQGYRYPPIIPYSLITVLLAVPLL